MSHRFLYALDRCLAQTPAWVFLLSGLLIISATLLVGPYLENRKLAWQRDLIRLQAQRLDEQEQAYRQFLADMDSHDPVLIQRMAYHYLHLRPQDAVIFGERPTAAQLVRNSGPLMIPAEKHSTVTTMLHRPMPVVGKDYPAFTMVDTLVIRLTTGPLRPLLAVAGAIFLALGLIPEARKIRFMPAETHPL